MGRTLVMGSPMRLALGSYADAGTTLDLNGNGNGTPVSIASLNGAGRTITSSVAVQAH